MLCGGDEMGRSQRGNNNAFCQDNEISWTRWDLSDDERALLEFTCRVSRLMKEHPVLRRRTFLQGRIASGTTLKDITWLTPEGGEMTPARWEANHVKCLGAVLAGDVGEVDDHGRPVVGETIVYLLNAHSGGVSFPLPLALGTDERWECLIDTSDARRHGTRHRAGAKYPLASRSVAVLRGVPGPARR
jgi:glycogen operon protein